MPLLHCLTGANGSQSVPGSSMLSVLRSPCAEVFAPRPKARRETPGGDHPDHAERRRDSICDARAQPVHDPHRDAAGRRPVRACTVVRRGGSLMRGAVMYAPGDVRVEERRDPSVTEATDALIRVSAACVCGSDLWPYRGVGDMHWPAAMGHEYVGIVEEVGSEVVTVEPGQFVVGSFWASNNTCAICRAGYQSACVERVGMGSLGAQAELLRVPLADGTLVATPDIPPDDLILSLVAASDVLGTGWFGAVAAEVGPGKDVAVVGDGAVGLLAVLAAKQLGAERIIAMSRHEPRQRLAREYGATDIVEERGDEGIAEVKELTEGLGAHLGVFAQRSNLPEPRGGFPRAL